jgi:hypothetical protein
MNLHRRSRAFVGLFLALGACGGGGSAGPPPEVAVRTLVYAVTECRENAQELSGAQKLVIQQGGREVTVKEFHFDSLPAGSGLCAAYGYGRVGGYAAVAYPLQRVAVSPDGSTVVFEVSDDHSILRPFRPQGFVPPEEEGFFAVQSDGSGLRRLGDASREPCFRFSIDPFFPAGLAVTVNCWLLDFSPDGQTLAYTDLGPDDAGQEAAQIFTMDVATGARKQITRLPPLTQPGPYAYTVNLDWIGFSKDGATLRFATNSITDGWQDYTVKADGTEMPVPARRGAPPVALPGAQLVTDLRITRPAGDLRGFPLPGTVLNGNQWPFEGAIGPRWEIFVGRGESDMLQLTSFGRFDTEYGGSALDRDEQRVLFTASADPFGTNPDENCQLFSIDTLGGDLRQLTRWGDGQHSASGCSLTNRPGCMIDGIAARDQRAGPDTAVFYSTCDPLGTNPDGGQIFAMRHDGTGLRQFTHTRGRVTEADGTVSVELPGIYTYPQSLYPQSWD